MANLNLSESALFIGGEWVPPARTGTIEVVSPITEEPIATVPAATKADVDRAVAAARRAFEAGPWPAMSVADRVAMLRRFGELLATNVESLAQIITNEMGCPISQSRAFQVENPGLILDAYLQAAADYPFQSVRRSARGQALVVREPVGVVAAVIPWNVPLTLAVQKIAPALIVGCTVVLKPAPETPLDAYAVARLLQEAGCPPGVVNVLPAEREVSQYLVSHPGISKVTFTGSSAAGRKIAEICGADLRRVTLELGGKSAAVVLDDADLDVTIEALRTGSFRNNGQVCSLKTRLVVPRQLQSEIMDRIGASLDSMAVGDPRQAETQIGPLVSARQRSVVEGFISQGLSDGARLTHGGGRPEIDRGWYVEPTAFADVDPDSTIAQREIFGPVLSVIPYDDEDQAVAIANNSMYGLNGAVFTRDTERGLRIARRLSTGTVELNGNPAGFLAPMGGVKHSGLGREFGPEGLDPFVELKSIGVSEDVARSLE